MSRSAPQPSRRRSASFEILQLESRIQFSAVFPNADEQYILELINRARANPNAEVARINAVGGWGTATPDLNEGLAPGTISGNAVQPLAMNPYLVDAARKHTAYDIANPNNPDPHSEVVNGVTLSPYDRAVAAGYPAGAGVSENIWSAATTSDSAADDVSLEQGTFVDYGANGGTPGRGHRLNLLNAGSNEIGLGLGMDPNFSIVTQDYGNAGATSFLTGVAIQDLNNDQFYEPGEGLGGVTITATRTSDNQVFSTTTWDAGGYSLALAPGTYNVVATGGTVGTPAPQTVTIGTQNVEADFIAATATLSPPVIVTQPANTTPFLSATTFSFSVSATGNPTPTVQWQVEPFGATSFTDIAGATAYTYTASVDPSLNGGQYQAVLTNSQGSVTTTPAMLTIQNGAPSPINITTYPADQTVNVGDTVTFNCVATGWTSAQWSVSTDNNNTSTDIPGATSLSYSFVATADMSGEQFGLSLSNSTGGPEVFANLTVNASPTAPTVVAQSTNTQATDGNAVLSVVASGFPAPTVQWQVQTTGTGATPAIGQRNAAKSTFTDIQGATNSSVTIPLSKVGVTHYRAVVTNANGSVTTKTIAVTANNKSPVTNDLSTLRTAAKAALSAITVCKNATASLVANLSSDLRRLKATKTQKALVTSLSNDEKASRDRFAKNETAVLNSLIHAAAVANSDSLKLAKDPSNTTLQAKMQADIAALQSAAAASTAPADASDCKFATDTQLPAIAAIAPTDGKLQNDVESGQNTAESIGQSLQAPMTIALSIATQLATDAQS